MNSRTDVMEKQVGGDHYKKHIGMQVWDIVDEYDLNFYEGNMLKYLLRKKERGNRIEDLQKLIHYAEKEIEGVGLLEFLNDTRLDDNEHIDNMCKVYGESKLCGKKLLEAVWEGVLNDILGDTNEKW